MDLRLGGKVALITGAGSGIGASIAGALAREGCTVCVTDVTPELAQRTEATLRQEGHEAYSLIMDVGDPEEVEHTIGSVVEDHGGIDILINNAGILKTEPLTESSTQDWKEVSGVNLSGALYCSWAVLPVMLDRGYGKIINISSVSAMKGGGSLGNTLYGITKAGVVAMTKGFARELAPHGINVNAIAPAVIETALTQDELQTGLKEQIRDRIPMKRLGEPADVATLAAYLASDVANYITGHTIPVDGGYLTN